MINIKGAKPIKIIPPASPGGNSWIEIVFEYSPVILPLLWYDCPPVGGRGKNYTGTNELPRNLLARMLRAYPHTVKFELNKEKGELLLAKVGGLSYFRMTVERLPDD